MSDNVFRHNVSIKQLWKHSNWKTVTAVASHAESNLFYNEFETPISATSPTNGHTYYMKCETRNRQNLAATCAFYSVGSAKCWATTDGVKETVYTSENLRFSIFRGYSNTQNAVMCVDYRMVLLDLTLMFGQGNEPTTVSAFKTLYPQIEWLSPFEPKQIGG